MRIRNKIDSVAVVMAGFCDIADGSGDKFNVNHLIFVVSGIGNIKQGLQRHPDRKNSFCQDAFVHNNRVAGKVCNLLFENIFFRCPVTKWIK